MSKRNAILLLSLPVVTLFLYASLTKLADYYNFRFGLSESPFISPFADVLAWLLPASELLIAAMILLPVTRLAGLYAAFILLILFTIYIAVMLLSGAEIRCSCGGVLEKMSWPMHIAFNLLFVVLSGVAILLERRNKTLNLSSLKI